MQELECQWGPNEKNDKALIMTHKISPTGSRDVPHYRFWNDVSLVQKAPVRKYVYWYHKQKSYMRYLLKQNKKLPYAANKYKKCFETGFQPYRAELEKLESEEKFMNVIMVD